MTIKPACIGEDLTPQEINHGPLPDSTATTEQFEKAANKFQERVYRAAAWKTIYYGVDKIERMRNAIANLKEAISDIEKCPGLEPVTEIKTIDNLENAVKGLTAEIKRLEDEGDNLREAYDNIRALNLKITHISAASAEKRINELLEASNESLEKYRVQKRRADGLQDVLLQTARIGALLGTEIMRIKKGDEIADKELQEIFTAEEEINVDA